MTPFCDSIVWHGMVFAINISGRVFMIKPDQTVDVLIQTLTGGEEEYLPPTRALRAMLDARKQ